MPGRRKTASQVGAADGDSDGGAKANSRRPRGRKRKVEEDDETAEPANAAAVPESKPADRVNKRGKRSSGRRRDAADDGTARVLSRRLAKSRTRNPSAKALEILRQKEEDSGDSDAKSGESKGGGGGGVSASRRSSRDEKSGAAARGRRTPVQAAAAEGAKEAHPRPRKSTGQPRKRRPPQKRRGLGRSASVSSAMTTTTSGDDSSRTSSDDGIDPEDIVCCVCRCAVDYSDRGAFLPPDNDDDGADGGKKGGDEGDKKDGDAGVSGDNVNDSGGSSADDGTKGMGDDGDGGFAASSGEQGSRQVEEMAAEGRDVAPPDARPNPCAGVNGLTGAESALATDGANPKPRVDRPSSEEGGNEPSEAKGNADSGSDGDGTGDTENDDKRRPSPPLLPARLHDPNNAILLCDAPGCDRAYHQRCHFVPVLAVPRGEWICLVCQFKEKLASEQERGKKKAKKNGSGGKTSAAAAAVAPPEEEGEAHGNETQRPLTATDLDRLFRVARKPQPEPPAAANGSPIAADDDAKDGKSLANQNKGDCNKEADEPSANVAPSVNGSASDDGAEERAEPAAAECAGAAANKAERLTSDALSIDSLRLRFERDSAPLKSALLKRELSTRLKSLIDQSLSRIRLSQNSLRAYTETDRARKALVENYDRRGRLPQEFWQSYLRMAQAKLRVRGALGSLAKVVRGTDEAAEIMEWLRSRSCSTTRRGEQPADAAGSRSGPEVCARSVGCLGPGVVPSDAVALLFREGSGERRREPRFDSHSDGGGDGGESAERAKVGEEEAAVANGNGAGGGSTAVPTKPRGSAADASARPAEGSKAEKARPADEVGVLRRGTPTPDVLTEVEDGNGAGAEGKVTTAAAAAKEKQRGEGKNEVQDDDDDMLSLDDLRCTVCFNGHATDTNDVLMCDGMGCFRAFHMRCVTPPVTREILEQMDDEDDDHWFCPLCTALAEWVHYAQVEYRGDEEGVPNEGDGDDDSTKSWEDANDVFPEADAEFGAAIKWKEGVRDEGSDEMLCSLLGISVGDEGRGAAGDGALEEMGSDDGDDSDDEDFGPVRKRKQRPGSDSDAGGGDASDADSKADDDDDSDDDGFTSSSESVSSVEWDIGKSELNALSSCSSDGEESSDSDSDNGDADNDDPSLGDDGDSSKDGKNGNDGSDNDEDEEDGRRKKSRRKMPRRKARLAALPTLTRRKKTDSDGGGGGTASSALASLLDSSDNDDTSSSVNKNKDVGTLDESNILTGKRNRTKVDYRRLNDAMFGDISDTEAVKMDGGDEFLFCGELDDDDSRRKKRRGRGKKRSGRGRVGGKGRKGSSQSRSNDEDEDGDDDSSISSKESMEKAEPSKKAGRRGCPSASGRTKKRRKGGASSASSPSPAKKRGRQSKESDGNSPARKKHPGRTKGRKKAVEIKGGANEGTPTTPAKKAAGRLNGGKCSSGKKGKGTPRGKECIVDGCEKYSQGRRCERMCLAHFVEANPDAPNPMKRSRRSKSTASPAANKSPGADSKKRKVGGGRELPPKGEDGGGLEKEANTKDAGGVQAGSAGEGQKD